MDNWGWIPGLCCLLAAVVLVLWNRRQTHNIMDSIEQMLSAAMDKNFTEKTFDENRMSALETKFAHYLSASAVSARNVAIEKDKIKTLIADISHQTKTPVSNLLLYSELLKEEALPESAKNSVDTIHSQAEALHFLINALVKMSRLENGIISLSPRPGKIQPLLQNAVERFLPEAEAKGLFLHSDQTDASAVFDQKWTTEALCNILDNAVKYTKQGGIAISTASYEMFTRLDISDSGPGIPEEEQAKIFSRFYRSEMARDYEGIGIGLYLAREIISGQGGYIKVVSTPGKGSVFSIFLPKEYQTFQNC